MRNEPLLEVEAASSLEVVDLGPASTETKGGDGPLGEIINDVLVEFTA